MRGGADKNAHMTRPFSDNIIFVDTEFSTLDPYKGEILSVGLVKPDGTELYLELEHEGEVSDWVKENIRHMLTQPKVSRAEARKRIRDFVGPGKPYMVTFVTQFDSIYLYKLFETDNPREDAFPFHKWPIDFAAILFANGRDPEHILDAKSALMKELGIDATRYRDHHALDDAKLLREAWMKFFQKK